MNDTQAFESTGQTPPLRKTTRAEETLGRRRRRDPAAAYNGAFLRLGVDNTKDDPNYVYHWFCDDKGRLQHFTEQDDWDFCENTDQAADPRNLNETSTRIRRRVGKDQSGLPLYAYRCRKLKEWQEEDLKERSLRSHERYERAVHDQTGDAEGIDAGDLKNSYIPAEVQAAIKATDGRARANAIRRSQRSFSKG